MLVSPLMMGLLGWDPDAPQHSARLAPQLPPQWERTAVRNLRVGETSLDVEFQQGAGRFVATLAARGPAIALELAIAIPPGARDARSATPGGTITDGQYTVTLHVSRVPTRVELEWTGGLAVEPWTMALEPGQQSQGLRILDYRYSKDRWILLVEGTAGHTYQLRLHGEEITRVDGAELVRREGAATTIAVTISTVRGRERGTAKITLHR